MAVFVDVADDQARGVVAGSGRDRRLEGAVAVAEQDAQGVGVVILHHKIRVLPSPLRSTMRASAGRVPTLYATRGRYVSELRSLVVSGMVEVLRVENQR